MKKSVTYKILRRSKRYILRSNTYFGIGSGCHKMVSRTNIINNAEIHDYWFNTREEALFFILQKI